MDGTLLDTESIWYDAWSNAEEHFNFKIPEKIKQSLIGMPKQNFEKIRNEIIPPYIEYEEIQVYRSDYFKKRTSENPIRVKKGTFELLNYCETNNIKKIVCTSSFSKRAIKMLTDTSLITHFDDIVTGDFVKKGKPDPEIYMLVLNRNRLSPENCIAIEDTSIGIIAASEAKLNSYFIRDMIDLTMEAERVTYKKLIDLNDVINELEEINSRK